MYSLKVKIDLQIVLQKMTFIMKVSCVM